MMRRNGNEQSANVATVWLDGCSGCHMSFLDIDERLIELADKIDLVYSPLVDNKEFPETVDVAIVEGAVATRRGRGEDPQDPRAHARSWCRWATAPSPATCRRCAIRSRSRRCCDRAYLENADMNPQRIPTHVPAGAAGAGPAGARGREGGRVRARAARRRRTRSTSSSANCWPGGCPTPAR